MKSGFALYSIAVTIALILVSAYAVVGKPKQEKVTIYKSVTRPLPPKPTLAQVLNVIKDIPAGTYAKPGCKIERGPNAVDTRIGCHDGNLTTGQFT